MNHTDTVTTTGNTTATADANAQAEVTQKRDPNTVTLDTPIKRGNGEITEVTLRKPSAGELRGVCPWPSCCR